MNIFVKLSSEYGFYALRVKDRRAQSCQQNRVKLSCHMLYARRARPVSSTVMTAGRNGGQNSYFWNSGFTTSQIQDRFQNDRMQCLIQKIKHFFNITEDKWIGRQSILILKAREQNACFSPIWIPDEG